MNLKQIYHSDLPNRPDADMTLEPKSEVVVEFLKAHPTKDPDKPFRIIKCYIPADAWVNEDGNIIIRYTSYPHGHDPYYTHTIYDKSRYPNLYKFNSVDVRSTLLLALGVLLGYDEESDCLRPFLDHVDEAGKNVYEKWTDIPQLKENSYIWTKTDKNLKL